MTSKPIDDDKALIYNSIRERNVTELIHFTTNLGLLGIVTSGQILSRTALRADQYLEHILRLNAAVRREDLRYHDYVNLSISAINARFFDFSANKWAAADDYCWVALSIDPTILTDQGVLFATGNMGYDRMEPGVGADGWESLFASSVHYGFGKYKRRPEGLGKEYPTDDQAEALYPKAVSIAAVNRIYVRNDTDAARANGVVAIGLTNIPVVKDPSKFMSGRV